MASEGGTTKEECQPDKEHEHDENRPRDTLNDRDTPDRLIGWSHNDTGLLADAHDLTFAVEEIDRDSEHCRDGYDLRGPHRRRRAHQARRSSRLDRPQSHRGVADHNDNREEPARPDRHVAIHNGKEEVILDRDRATLTDDEKHDAL